MMSYLLHRNARRDLIAYFDGTLPPSKRRHLLAHLTTCEECRASHALLASRGSGPAEGGEERQARRDRVEQSLFAERPRPQHAAARRPVLLVAGFATAVALVALVVIVLPRSPAPPTAKGAAEVDLDRFVSIAAYRRAGGGLTPVDGQIDSDDALAFAYTHRGDAKFDRLMIFGVDEHFDVYWFSPQWTDSETNPAAVPARRGTNVELPFEVAHDYRGDRLKVVGLFCSRRDLTVRVVEDQLQRHRRGGLTFDGIRASRLVAGCGQHVVALEIAPR